MSRASSLWSLPRSGSCCDTVLPPYSSDLCSHLGVSLFSRFAFRATATLIAAVLTVGSVSAATPALAAESGATAAATSTRAVAFTGTVTALGDDDESSGSETNTVELFRVVGYGYLSVDFAAVDASAGETLTVNLAVPADLDLGTSAESIFAAVAAYGESNGALVATAATAAARPIGGGTPQARVNQTSAKAAVHTVFAVLVTPKDVSSKTAHSSQTEENVADAVQHASDYWSDQSDGRVTFDLAGTTPWYKSAASCKTSAGSAKLWNEAAAKAKATLGYTDAFNTHLVLFFPANITSQCGGGIGLGTVGGSINSGGLVWTVGTNSALGKSTLTHELGHNLSFGHADWADCRSATPAPGLEGTTGCTIRRYGDVLDVMGFGMTGYSGGTLSSPHAIRGGIWGDDDYAVAPGGSTETYTLNALSSNEGLRSVVVEDSTGVNYFVEFRNYTGADAQYESLTPACDSQICIPAEAGVRVLRLEENFGVKGLYGDDAYLIGRTVSGTKRVNYTQGESFATNGMNVTVTNITSTTATVEITRGATSVTRGDVYLDKSLSMIYDYNYRTGDTFTIFLGTTWEADDYSFQWFLTGQDGERSPIAGATEQSYTIQVADLGGYLSYDVTASGPNPVTHSSYEEDGTPYWGAILEGYKAAGTASVVNSDGQLKVVTDGWDAGTTFTYQWYRDSTAISTAKTAFYTPVAADRGKKLKARVSGTQPGYLAITADTPAKNYSISATGTLVISGAARVGSTVRVNDGLTYSTVDGTPVISARTYQWYRDGKAIAGATSFEYTATSTDLGKKLSAQLTAAASGYVPFSKTTAATAKVARGTITGFAAADVAKSALVLTAVAQWEGDVPAGTTYAYQWYRGSTAIKKATKLSYTLVSADYNKNVSVRVTAKRAGYSQLALRSVGQNYSVVATGAPTIDDTSPARGQLLTATAPEFNVAVEPTFQWLVNGKTIAGETNATYTVPSKYRGKVLSVKVTARAEGLLSYVKSSAKTKKVT